MLLETQQGALISRNKVKLSVITHSYIFLLREASEQRKLAENIEGSAQLSSLGEPNNRIKYGQVSLYNSVCFACLYWPTTRICS